MTPSLITLPGKSLPDSGPIVVVTASRGSERRGLGIMPPSVELYEVDGSPAAPRLVCECPVDGWPLAWGVSQLRKLGADHIVIFRAGCEADAIASAKARGFEPCMAIRGGEG